MKYLLVVILTFCSNAFADWDDPKRIFDMRKNAHNNIDLTVKAVKNISRVCREESKKRLGREFGHESAACSFWNGQKCVIFVPEKATMHILGHELLHCLQYDWH